MHLLLIGGGVFLGRALVDAALQRGHALTVFNRGQRRSTWPDGVEVITGDRQTQLDRLAGRRWDSVIDTCGYLPAEVAASAAATAGSGPYLFVSSISAYARLERAGADETAALAPFDAVAPDDLSPAHYGAQKAACEAALSTVAGARALVVRPGLVCGPGDPTGRFSHWPWRIAEGGRVVAPDAPPDQPLQCIDVRDLAAWMLHLLEAGSTGTFHATSPVFGWDALLSACREAAQRCGRTPAEVQRVPEATLLAQGVQPWAMLPLWLPSSEAEHRGFLAVSTARAESAGLRTRSLADTATDILREDPAGPDDPRRAGRLPAGLEARLLAL
jgi:2'-hydroxyisoflavone reductase